ncbi:MAG: TraR/DksA family transcriptional regulator [Candidatus Magasanikbacteria bacterium]
MDVSNTQYFSESFLERMEEILVAEKEKIEEKLNMHEQHIEESESVGDSNKEDKIGTLKDKALDESLKEELEDKLEDIKAALERLEKGTYGICKYTEKPINKKRLLARPTSTSSVEAKKFLTDEN